MAAITNTVVTTALTTNREQLSNIVSRIDPQDTPIKSLIGNETATSVHPEWSTHVLEAPGENAQPEGNLYSLSAVAPPVRLGNYTQIFTKSWIISNTQEAVSEAGNVIKKAEQKVIAGIGINKDVEFSIVTANASVAGATRKSGSLQTWLTSNVSRGATGANGGFNVGTGLTVAATPGTQRAFTKTLLDTVMQSAYQNGANVKYLVVSPYVKSVFVGFMSDANVAPFRHAVTDGNKNVIIANADIYDGPFGKVTVVPNRVMAVSATTARNAFLIDPAMLKWSTLRPMQEDKNLATNADAVSGVINHEGCLAVKNEKGLGVVADVFGLTAAT